VIGVGVAIGLSLLEFIYRSATPPVAELGRLPGTVVYKDVRAFPTAIVYPGILVVRLVPSVSPLFALLLLLLFFVYLCHNSFYSSISLC
jgi:MFS superfamily sulfate permease-like transporter